MRRLFRHCLYMMGLCKLLNVAPFLLFFHCFYLFSVVIFFFGIPGDWYSMKEALPFVCFCPASDVCSLLT